MNHTTSYQHCHDQEGEDAAARQDAIERRSYEIQQDPVALLQVVEEMMCGGRHDEAIAQLLMVSALMPSQNVFVSAIEKKQMAAAEVVLKAICGEVRLQAAIDVDSKGEK